MRYLVIVKASEESEAGVLPKPEEFAEMGKFNDELIAAGVMLAGEGITPTSQGKRIRFNGADRQLINGPFTPARDQFAGYWIWKVNSEQEAIDWLKRAPFSKGEE